MKFHGRIHPGRITDSSRPIEVRIHQPKKCSGVTIKIWELDAFLGADGKPRREGTPDDLLATFTGDIEPAPPAGGRPPEWRKFKVSSATIEEAPAGAVRFKLVFPGDPTVHEIPIISEAAEVEGTEYELGFSIEVGGAEKFRTRSPCLLATPRILGRVRELLVLAFDDDGEPMLDDAEEVPPSFDRLVLGAAGSEDDELTATMTVLLRGRVHPSGYVIADTDDAVTPLGLNVARALAAVPHHQSTDPGQPPTALGIKVAKDGAIEVVRPDRSFTRTMFVAGSKIASETRGEHRHLTFDADLLSEAATAAPPLATRTIPVPPRRTKRRR